MQVPVPKVESCALLMVTFTGSDTDQVTFIRFDVTAAHPAGRSPPNATKRCESPGGGAVWSAVAVGGETLRDPKEHLLEVPQPAIESDRERAKVTCQDFIADNRTPLRNGGIALVHFEEASLEGPRPGDFSQCCKQAITLIDLPMHRGPMAMSRQLSGRMRLVGQDARLPGDCAYYLLRRASNCLLNR